MTTCSICLEDSNDETKTVACNHIFHATCIDEWLKSHSTCPVCRMQLRKESPENNFDEYLRAIIRLSGNDPDVMTRVANISPNKLESLRNSYDKLRAATFLFSSRKSN